MAIHLADYCNDYDRGSKLKFSLEIDGEGEFQAVILWKPTNFLPVFEFVMSLTTCRAWWFLCPFNFHVRERLKNDCPETSERFKVSTNLLIRGNLYFKLRRGPYGRRESDLGEILLRNMDTATRLLHDHVTNKFVTW
jgi:hypothetical protein